LSLELVRQKVVSPTRMVELMSVNPARILGVQGGSLSAGNPADVTVIDPEKSFTYRQEDILSKSRNSPFIDQQFTGKAVMTIMCGLITHNELD